MPARNATTQAPAERPPPPTGGMLPSVAAFLFILAFARDMIILFLLIIGSALASAYAIPVSGAVAIFMVFPLLGVAGCSLAALACLQRKDHSLGAMAGAVGVVGSSYPGVLVVGPVGLLLSVAGLAILVYAKPQFVEEPKASPAKENDRDG